MSPAPGKLPVDQPKFWRARLENAKARGEIHRSVYEVDLGTWRASQEAHRILLTRILKPGCRLLDAGCGYGSLLEILPKGIEYVGVDISPDFIEEARKLYPDKDLRFGDISRMPMFPDGHFDVCIARSMEGMIKVNLGYPAWFAIERELYRVAHRVVMMSYTEHNIFFCRDTTLNPARGALCTIQGDGGRLDYTAPDDVGTCEIVDICTDPDKRRRGVATAMVQALRSRIFGTIYAFTRITNDEARCFYRKLGFHEIVLPDYYRGMDGCLEYLRCEQTTPPD